MAEKDGAPPLGGGTGVILSEVTTVGGDDGLELGDEVGGQGTSGVVGEIVGGDAGVVGADNGGVGMVVGGDAGVVGVADGGVVEASAETLMVNF